MNCFKFSEELVLVSCCVFCLLARLVSRQAARKIATELVLGGQLVPDSNACQAASQWLTEQGVLEGGHVVDAFISLKTTLTHPVLCETGGWQSRLFIKKHLKDGGWSHVDGSTRASISDRRFNANGHLEYFLLLKNFQDGIAAYDEQFGFRHSQLKSYYDAMIAMLKRAVPCL